jgi:hypothetical protein
MVGGLLAAHGPADVGAGFGRVDVASRRRSAQGGPDEGDGSSSSDGHARGW